MSKSQKPMRKIIVTMHTRDPYVWDKKTGTEVYGGLGIMPESVRQWFQWDEYVDIEIDLVTGEATLLPAEE